MLLRKLATGAAILFCLHAPAMAEMFKIDNPASNIYNPATKMDNPNPLSPPTQPVPPQTVKEVPKATEPAKQYKEQPHAQSKPTIPQKRYKFKTVGEYLYAAKKAFNSDNYREIVSITEDALRRINSGTLKATKAAKQKLTKYKDVGYRMLE